MSYVLFPSTIKPTGPFPSHEDTFGKGGFVALTGQSESLVDYETISNFLNEQIPTLRRKVGMLAYISSINQYYTCSSITGESGISGDWSRQYFSGRYFHGPSAPELNDLQVGERWFDTVAGTEYTYIPIEEGSTYNAWVDIDHLGGGGSGTLKYFYGENEPSGATVGDKWFNTNLGAELTYLPNVPDQAEGITGNIWVMVNSLAQGVSSGIYVLKTGDTMSGSLTASRAFRSSNGTFENNEFITKAYGDATYLGGNLSDYVKKTGDIMEGTLTGTSSSFASLTASNGFIGTLTGISSSFTSLTASNGFIGTLTGTEASFNAFAEVSNSGSYENQPLLSVQKIGGNNVNDDGFYPGTTGFMNLPRLVLNNFSDNLWGWPKAIDFMTRPTSGAENSVIGWRIGDTYTSGGNSWLTFWGAPSQTFGNIGISAGPSGAGLTALGRFQYGVNREDTNGFYALKSFRMSDSPEFRDNEFVTKDYVNDRHSSPYKLYMVFSKGNDNTSYYHTWGNFGAANPPTITSFFNWNVRGVPADGHTGYSPDVDSGAAAGIRPSYYFDLDEEKVGFKRPWAVYVKRSFTRTVSDASNPYIAPSNGTISTNSWHSTGWTRGGTYPDGTGYSPLPNGYSQRGKWSMNYPPQATCWTNSWVESDKNIRVRWNGYQADFHASSWFNYVVEDQSGNGQTAQGQYINATLGGSDNYYFPGTDIEKEGLTEYRRIKIATITDYTFDQSPFKNLIDNIKAADAYITEIEIHPHNPDIT